MCKPEPHEKGHIVYLYCEQYEKALSELGEAYGALENAKERHERALRVYRNIVRTHMPESDMGKKLIAELREGL